MRKLEVKINNVMLPVYYEQMTPDMYNVVPVEAQIGDESEHFTFLLRPQGRHKDTNELLYVIDPGMDSKQLTDGQRIAANAILSATRKLLP